ncbi:MAG: hypothetical protein ACXWTT_08295 [Methylobacter sp.]
MQSLHFYTSNSRCETNAVRLKAGKGDICAMTLEHLSNPLYSLRMVMHWREHIEGVQYHPYTELPGIQAQGRQCPEVNDRKKACPLAQNLFYSMSSVLL